VSAELTLARLGASLADRYRLERELGQGGMATVYLAEDLRHDRKVAIKVLKPELAAVIGAERFLREIKTIAGLQHPHILGLIDSGQLDGTAFYVMPFVEGESLRDRLAREKQLPVAEAVRLACEVASALDYAHRHGVIHRDIKPENILLHDGKALVADFGIALAATKAGGDRMTQTGMSLGTPHYMSPEQAMGEREITARSDVYALGAMTYEMLVGDPPFTGSTAQAIVAKAMTEKPVPPSRLRDTVPDGVEDAILIALAKLPADRFASAAEFATALTATRPSTARTRLLRSARAPGRARFVWPAAAVAAGLTALWGWLRPTPRVVESPPSRLAVLAPELGGSGTALQRQLAITPDGTTLLYVAVANGENVTLRRDLATEETTRVPGVPPFLAGYAISRDGREFVGYLETTRAYYRIPLDGGNGRALPREVDDPDVVWTADGSLWFGNSNDVEQGLRRLGPDDVVTRPLDRRSISLVPMDVLPGDRSMLMISRPFGSSAGPVLLLDLTTGETKPLLNVDVVQVRYSAGHLVYALTNGTLDAVRFDPKHLTVSGRPITIATGVSLSGTGTAQFAASANGIVAYIPEAERSLVLIDREGATRPAVTDSHNYHSPRFSPDGRRIAVDFTTIDGRDVWVLDRASGAMSRTTFNRDGHDASWAPDGRSLSFISASKGILGIHRTTLGTTEPAESLFSSLQLGYTGIWLRDGRALVTTASSLMPGSRSDIAVLRNGGRGPLEPLVASRFDEQYPAVSPDGRWVTYVSNQSGRNEVYLRVLEGTGEAFQVSVDGGVEPVWGPDGRELFYRGGPATAPVLIAAELQLGTELAVPSRRALFGVADMATAIPHSNYDVSPDGRTFVMVRNNPATRIMVIQNLPALVAKLRGTEPTTP
jgi:Tol biopolymer transport system component/tRNA A-37 threonylcarbamoyl transferase component Bud32